MITMCVHADASHSVMRIWWPCDSDGVLLGDCFTDLLLSLHADVELSLRGCCKDPNHSDLPLLVKESSPSAGGWKHAYWEQRDQTSVCRPSSNVAPRH